MSTIDLDGPLEEFRKRTNQIRAIAATIESAVKNKGLLTTNRQDVDLSTIGAETSNTTNAMSLVFLASSFEEFIREEIRQCGIYVSEKYTDLEDGHRNAVRGLYWTVCLERFRRNNTVLTKNKPKVPDTAAITQVRALLDTARGFVIDNDPMHIDQSLFYQHSNNFRPHVVDEIAQRVGIANLIDTAADSSKLRNYFGETKKMEVSKKLKAKLNDFYEKRNLVVHSLTGNTGYGVEVVWDYIDLFEFTAESIKNVLTKTLEKW